MKAGRRSLIAARLTVVLTLLLAGHAAYSQDTPTTEPTLGSPGPVPVFIGPEFVRIRGTDFTRYRYTIVNFKSYPGELFAPAPRLPPCGTKKGAARTWVEVYEQSGKRLNGFCAFTKPSDLKLVWFALETGTIPPSWIYIEMLDRQTKKQYKSMLVETTQ